MDRQPVTSSTIKSIGYADGEMHIEFSNGRVYSYAGPKVEAHFQALLAAESVGKHFAAHVRKCPETVCTPLDPEAPTES
jgi:hypothetical protein